MDELLSLDRLPSAIGLQWFAEGDNPGEASASSQEAGPESADQGSGESSGFLDDLPEPLRGSKSLAKFADKASLAQSYLALESKLGRSVELPGKDASPEVWEKYFARTGRPKTADDYQLQSHQGYKGDPVFDAAFKQAAYREGISAKAAAGLYQEVTRRMAEDEGARNAATIRARESALQGLKTAWGADFDANLASAKKVYQSIFSPEAQAAFHAAGLEDDPRLVQDLARHGARFKSDSLVEGKPPKAGVPPATNDPDHPYAYMMEMLGR